ncbi:MAG: GlsB/YeaQ/YmgE family stress response membrane protein [Gemmatimonadota bacterium]
MTLIDLLLFLLVAGVIGSLGQAIVGFDTGGCLVSIAIGFIGALLGAWLGRALGVGDLFVLEVAGTSFPVVWSIIGAALFVAVIRLISRGGR